MIMTNEQVRDYLYQQIPLSQAMGVEVDHATTKAVALRIPLGPNINHRETAFGGSISAAGILSCWTLVHLRLAELKIPTRLVIHKNKMIYREPIAGDFESVCRFDDQTAWDQVLTMLERWGKAKLQLQASLLSDGKEAAEFQGSFVVVKV
jgi:thioesterase domain-containing protein